MQLLCPATIRIGLAVGLVAAVSYPAVAQASALSPPQQKLVGVWEARQRFGPGIRGPLLVVRRSAGWVAEIAGHSAQVIVRGTRVSFRIAGDRGEFDGVVRPGGATIVGFWTQPAGVMIGKYASPVILRRGPGAMTWQGTVTPLDDLATLYLVVRDNGDGTLGAFLRNPERNIGVFANINRLVPRDTTVALDAPSRDGKSTENTIATGTYDTENAVLSVYVPSRGGTYDFNRIDNDPDNEFYPRPKADSHYAYRAPIARRDGWPVGSLQDAGISTSAIERFVQMLVDLPDTSVHSSAIHGVLIARHGKLVLEEYFHGYSADTPHDTRSAAKSLTSVLAGAAMFAGAPLRTSTPVYEAMYGGTLPEALDPRKRRTTLGNLLTMTPGWNCDDADDASPGNEDTMQSQTAESDWYRYTLNLPMVRDPGKLAVYCSASANMAGGVIARTTRTPLTVLFRDLLAKPLGIERYYMDVQPTGEPYMGGGMFLLPRDFLKFGQVMLDGGTWQGRRIVSAYWARSSTSAHYDLRGVHYGYLWWVVDYPYRGKTVRAFFAGGNGGQVVLGVPQLDLLIGFFGGNYSDRVLYVPQRVFVPQYILPAIDPGP